MRVMSVSLVVVAGTPRHEQYTIVVEVASDSRGWRDELPERRWRRPFLVRGNRGVMTEKRDEQMR